MNKIDRDELWHDALTDVASDDFQALSLERALSESRRIRRARKTARRLAVAVTGMVALIILAVWQSRPGSSSSTQMTAALPKTANPAVKFLSDNELLAMFPGQPLALFGPPDDRQLIFLAELPDSASEDTP